MATFTSRMSILFLLLIGTTVIPSSDAVGGFAVGGIVKGSLAAGWQSSIGNVAAGSTFATLQSWGATGALATVTTVASPVAAVGAGLAAVAYLFS